MAQGTEPHLILVGLPGAGKSTVAPVLADRLGRSALDFDAEIERREGMPVAEIFARRGEGHLRGLEHALTLELRDRPAMVLAPGGGWLARADTVALLRPPALLVYLRTSPEVALRRMGAAVRDRPLLAGRDPGGALQRLLSVRGARYETSDFRLDVDLLEPQQVADSIASWFRAGGAGSADRSASGG